MGSTCNGQNGHDNQDNGQGARGSDRDIARAFKGKGKRKWEKGAVAWDIT